MERKNGIYDFQWKSAERVLMVCVRAGDLTPEVGCISSGDRAVFSGHHQYPRCGKKAWLCDADET